MIDSSNVIPEIFEFSYGPSIGQPSIFKFENGEFIPHIYSYNKEKIVPTKEQWIKFWEKLEKIGVWYWNEHYYPEHEYLDGLRWSLKIHLNDNKIESSGVICFPGKNGETVENKITFRRLLLALNKLIDVNTEDIRIES